MNWAEEGFARPFPLDSLCKSLIMKPDAAMPEY